MVQNKQKQFTTKFKNTIERENIIKTQIPFLVAVSGGLDSTCLLSMIHELPTIIPDQVWVVYVDHAQRKES
ncbi:MAG: ATP-binding protein, partial [Lactobacillaceae bacterium]